MVKFINLILSIVVISILYFAFSKVVLAVDCLNINPNTVSSGDADFCMAELEKIKNQYAPAQEKNKQDLAKLQAKVNDLNKRITSMTIFQKEKKILLMPKKF